MALSQDRIALQGQTPHRHEIAAFDFVRNALPNTAPTRLWAFCDLVDAGGRRYDLDLLILGYHALYLVEVKSYPGQVRGDAVDWEIHYPDGGRQFVENPLRTTNHKAKVLASLLERQFARDPDARSRNMRAPWVQGLVFLANDHVQVGLDEPGRNHVLTQATFARAITHGDFPGAPPQIRTRPINTPQAAATTRALTAIGLRPSVASLKVNDLVLRELLEEGTYYQDFIGAHPTITSMQRRVRTYVIPPDTTTERRDQYFRAARREAQHLGAVADHPGVLRLYSYSAEGPLGGPALVFDQFEHGQPLDAFLRTNRELAFSDRIALIEQIAEALAFCHRKSIVHRALSPRTVLVRRLPPLPNGATLPLEVRLYNFQLATEGDSSGTVHVNTLLQVDTAVYLAPEVINNPSRADQRADVFSLGCITYLILTGRPPGASLDERAQLLAQQGGHLSIAATRNDLALYPKASEASDDDRRLRSLDEIVAMATEEHWAARADDAIEWLNLLLDLATAQAPAPTTSYVHPLQATAGDMLDGSLEVVRLLGTGSTSRVLQVRRDDTTYALKVASSPELDDRVGQEGDVLALIARSHEQGRSFIVEVEESLTLGDRTCLLMTDAGDSVAAVIAREGPASLDYARRWGEALLRALETLENLGIQHRDIKPANLGVLPSDAKRRRDLLLFDFSLSTVPLTAITAGTPAYRDPFLVRRGRWDAAADRWSTAITLHEIATGIRPTWGPDDEPLAAAPAGQDALPEITLAAERFDAAARGRLHAFFRKALARDVAARFESAEQMRTEWIACFAARPATAPPSDVEDVTASIAPAPEPAAVAPPARAPLAEDDVPLPPSADLARLAPDRAIESLPLGPRAKNALDRAGLLTLAELLAAPRNRFLSTRGVGRKVHEQIHAFVDAYREAAGAQLALTAAAPLHPDYRGRASKVGFIAGLPPGASAALEDAGLPLTSEVAATPREQVHRILADHAGALELVVSYLRATSDQAATASTNAPATIEDWLDALMPPEPRSGRGSRGKAGGRTSIGYARMLIGLEPLPGAPAMVAGAAPQEVDVPSMARALKVTPARIYFAITQARDHWLGHPAIGELHRRTQGALATLGGVASLAALARALPVELPHRAGIANPQHAAALTRIAAETLDADALAQARIHDTIWVATTPAHLEGVKRLGRAGDQLAQRQPLPSSEEVADVLRRVALESPTASLPTHRLVAIAADASTSASVSARLELYPRGLAADRAVMLAAGALPPMVVLPDDVQRMVRARYPDAAPLPTGEALAPLLGAIGLDWNEALGGYLRRGALPPPTQVTGLPQRQATTHTSHRPPAAHSPEAIEAAEFERTMRLAVERRHFRVLDVSARDDERTADELHRRFGATHVSLERAVLDHVERIVESSGIDAGVVEEADRGGPSARDDWDHLRELMRQAGTLAVDDVLRAGRTVVVTQPGILARYGLTDVIQALVTRAQADDAPAIFLINPTDAQAMPATIDGAPRPLPIPLLSQAQRLRVPQAWLNNAHRGAI